MELRRFGTTFSADDDARGQEEQSMRVAIRFIVLLVLFVGLLIWSASTLLNTSSRRWFERDIGLRAQLAVTGAREALVQDWRADDLRGIRRVLTEITRDE